MTWALYIRIIKKSFLWILLITAICAAAATAASLWLLDKEYDAKTTMYVINNPGTDSSYLYEELQANLDLINDYKSILYTNKVIDLVKKDLLKAAPDFVSMPNELIRKKLIIETTSNSRVFNIIYRDTSPKTAQNVSIKFAEKIRDEAVSLVYNDTLIIYDSAALPLVPSEPNLAKNIPLAAVGGFFGTIFLLFFFNYFKYADKDLKEE